MPTEVTREPEGGPVPKFSTIPQHALPGTYPVVSGAEVVENANSFEESAGRPKGPVDVDTIMDSPLEWLNCISLQVDEMSLLEARQELGACRTAIGRYKAQEEKAIVPTNPIDPQPVYPPRMKFLLEHVVTAAKNTIKVSAGHYVDLASPDPETIDIKSIAAALSKTCRFGGHCPKYYTVAEHCFHAVGLAAQDQLGGDVLRAILLHDATEAYVGDVVKPLKAMLPEYQIIESNIEQAVSTRFNVDFIRHNDLIKRYDRLMLKAEKIQMWPDDREEWFGFAGLPTRVVNFQYWHPEMAEEQFLKLAAALEL